MQFTISPIKLAGDRITTNLHGKSAAFRKKFVRWTSIIGEDWKTRANAAWNAHDAWEKEQEKKQHEKWKQEMVRKRQNEIRRDNIKQHYAKIAIYTKWVVMPLVFILGGLGVLAIAGLLVIAVYAIGKVIYVKWNTVAIIAMIKTVGPAVGFAVAFILALVLIVYAIIKLVKCLGYLSFAFPSVKMGGLLDSLEKAGTAISTAIAAPFQIFFDYAKTFKQNNCPAIKWKEEK